MKQMQALVDALRIEPVIYRWHRDNFTVASRLPFPYDKFVYHYHLKKKQLLMEKESLHHSRSGKLTGHMQ